MNEEPKYRHQRYCLVCGNKHWSNSQAELACSGRSLDRLIVGREGLITKEDLAWLADLLDAELERWEKESQERSGVMYHELYKMGWHNATLLLRQRLLPELMEIR